MKWNKWKSRFLSTIVKNLLKVWQRFSRHVKNVLITFFCVCVPYFMKKVSPLKVINYCSSLVSRRNCDNKQKVKLKTINFRTPSCKPVSFVIISEFKSYSRWPVHGFFKLVGDLQLHCLSCWLCTSLLQLHFPLVYV